MTLIFCVNPAYFSVRSCFGESGYESRSRIISYSKQKIFYSIKLIQNKVESVQHITENIKTRHLKKLDKEFTFNLKNS